jgi:hypothetical protein
MLFSFLLESDVQAKFIFTGIDLDGIFLACTVQIITLLYPFSFRWIWLFSLMISQTVRPIAASYSEDRLTKWDWWKGVSGHVERNGLAGNELTCILYSTIKSHNVSLCFLQSLSLCVSASHSLFLLLMPFECMACSGDCAA